MTGDRHDADHKDFDVQGPDAVNHHEEWIPGSQGCCLHDDENRREEPANARSMPVHRPRLMPKTAEITMPTPRAQSLGIRDEDLRQRHGEEGLIDSRNVGNAKLTGILPQSPGPTRERRRSIEEQ